MADWDKNHTLILKRTEMATGILMKHNGAMRFLLDVYHQLVRLNGLGRGIIVEVYKSKLSLEEFAKKHK